MSLLGGRCFGGSSVLAIQFAYVDHLIAAWPTEDGLLVLLAHAISLLWRIATISRVTSTKLDRVEDVVPEKVWLPEHWKDWTYLHPLKGRVQMVFLHIEFGWHLSQGVVIGRYTCRIDTYFCWEPPSWLADLNTGSANSSSALPPL